MKVEFPSISIVLLGQFRPDNYLPKKLADGKLIPRKIADAVTYTALVPELQLQFSFPWGTLFVLQDRFQISTTEAPYVRICDFALKALSDLTPNAVVTSFGINRDGHWDLGSEAARNKLGARLAPPEEWGYWGKKIRESSDRAAKVPSTEVSKAARIHGGVVHIQMRYPFVEDGIAGWLDVSVAPSSVVPDNKGVLFRANHHHYAIPKEHVNEGVGEKVSDITDRLLSRLSDNFENSIAEAESIFQGIINS